MFSGIRILPFAIVMRMIGKHQENIRVQSSMSPACPINQSFYEFGEDGRLPWAYSKKAIGRSGRQIGIKENN